MLTRQFAHVQRHFLALSTSGQRRFVGDAATTTRSDDVEESLRKQRPTEADHLSHNYRTYLESSRKLADLHEKYRGRPKTIEESANLVGLTVPERRTFD